MAGGSLLVRALRSAGAVRRAGRRGGRHGARGGARGGERFRELLLRDHAVLSEAPTQPCQPGALPLCMCVRVRVRVRVRRTPSESRAWKSKVTASTGAALASFGGGERALVAASALGAVPCTQSIARSRHRCERLHGETLRNPLLSLPHPAVWSCPAQRAVGDRETTQGYLGRETRCVCVCVCVCRAGAPERERAPTVWTSPRSQTPRSACPGAGWTWSTAPRGCRAGHSRPLAAPLPLPRRRRRRRRTSPSPSASASPSPSVHLP